MKKIETILVNGNSGGDRITGAVSYPIYQSVTFKHPALNMSTGYDYSRCQNPTREEVEKTIAQLENGAEAIAFSSGVSAITACIHLFAPGDHIILSEDLYGGTFRLFNDIYNKFGIEASFVNTTSRDAVMREVRKETKAIFIETPSNPMMKVTDIREMSIIAKEFGLLLIVDNTFLTPYYQKPLTLGADLVVHSATKYLSGHDDVLAGFVVGNNETIIKKLKQIQIATGAVLSPFESWLILRGLKTLHIRMDRSQKNALKIAHFLDENEKVESVYYVGLSNSIGYDINKKQATGFGSTLSFRVKDSGMIERILNNVSVINFAESLGGVETLITYPYTQTHADIPNNIKERLGIDNYLLRLSVGIENIEDLIYDLEKVL